MILSQVFPDMLISFGFILPTIAPAAVVWFMAIMFRKRIAQWVFYNRIAASSVSGLLAHWLFYDTVQHPGPQSSLGFLVFPFFTAGAGWISLMVGGLAHRFFTKPLTEQKATEDNHPRYLAHLLMCVPLLLILWYGWETRNIALHRSYIRLAEKTSQPATLRSLFKYAESQPPNKASLIWFSMAGNQNAPEEIRQEAKKRWEEM